MNDHRDPRVTEILARRSNAAPTPRRRRCGACARILGPDGVCRDCHPEDDPEAQADVELGGPADREPGPAAPPTGTAKLCRDCGAPRNPSNGRCYACHPGGRRRRPADAAPAPAPERARPAVEPAEAAGVDPIAVFATLARLPRSDLRRVARALAALLDDDD